MSELLKNNTIDDKNFKLDVRARIDSRLLYISKFIGNEPGSRILDLGCRNGELQKYLKKNLEYYGVDLVEEYKTYIKNYFIFDITNTKYPFKNDFFDYIYIGEVLEHVSNFFHVFEEAHRILKFGGKLIITVPNNFHIIQAISVINKNRYLKRRLDIDIAKSMGTHIHSLSEVDILKIAQMIGMTPVYCDRFFNIFKTYKLPEFTVFKPFAKFILYIMSK